MSEQKFEYRIQRILKDKGYLVINVSMPRFGGHLFDLIAMKDQIVFPIEIKGRKTPYPEDQLKRQMEACKTAKTGFFVIRQSKKRGKIRLAGMYSSSIVKSSYAERVLRNDLKKWIEGDEG